MTKKNILFKLFLAVLIPLSVFVGLSTSVAAQSSPSLVSHVSGNSSNSNTVSTSQSMIYLSSNVYLASIATRGYSEVVKVEGAGLTWTKLASQCSGRNATGVDVWIGKSSENSEFVSNIVTATLDSSVSNAAISVASYSGVNLANSTGSVLGLNTNDVDGECSGGTDSASYSGSIATSSNNIVYLAIAPRIRSHTSTSDFIHFDEIYNGSGGDVAGLVLSQNTNPKTQQAVAGDFDSTVDWALIAVEVVSADSSPTQTNPPSGLEGDANGDGVVDGLDYLVWLSNYDTSTTAGVSAGDFDNNGVVDGLDYLVWLSNYGESVEATATPVSTIAPTPTITPTATPLSTSTPTNAPTSTPTSTAPPPPSTGDGIWISRDRLLSLPTSGSAWNNLVNGASGFAGTPDLSNQDDDTNVKIMAKALVYARTGNSTYFNEVRSALNSIVNSGTYNGRALALGRELGAYVIAADLINLKSADSNLDNQFRNKIKELLTTPTTSGPDNLVECHEVRANNWGTMCGFSRAAVAAYLGDQQELSRVAQVFKGWLGDRSSYSGFSYGDTSWQCDPNNPVGINPAGCTKEGLNIDGVLPEEQRRGGSFTTNPDCQNYVWGGLAGSLGTGIILHQSGYDTWNWEDQAHRRALEWLHSSEVKSSNWCAASGDNTWEPHIVNYYYGTNFSAPLPASPGKNAGWTDWTHSK